MQGRLKDLTAKLNEATHSHPEAKQVVLDWEKTLKEIGENRAHQKQPDDEIKKEGERGAVLAGTRRPRPGRILLAVLLVMVASRRTLLRIFQVPGLLIFPLTYWYLYREHPDWFTAGVFLCGLTTVAQFSYFGEFLPKVFPLHFWRGTGASFATNVGGRMVGTSAAFVTTSMVAPLLSGNTFLQIATAAAIVGTTVYAIGLIAAAFLPEPKGEE